MNIPTTQTHGLDKTAAAPHSHILVVDDEPNIRLMVRTILEAEGHTVAEAGNGSAALEAIRGAAFDLMLLDLNMPVFDGMTVLERLEAEALPHKPRVIVLTAYGSVGAAVKATRRGARDFLEKPVTPTQLREAVNAVLAEPEPLSMPAEPRGFEGVLDRIRKALRVSDVATAESLLVRAADVGQSMASYYNLLGILYEIRGEQRLARKMYSKAMGADPKYHPAEQNMRRIYELSTFGRTDIPPALGDGPDALSGEVTRHVGKSSYPR